MMERPTMIGPNKKSRRSLLLPRRSSSKKNFVAGCGLLCVGFKMITSGHDWRTTRDLLIRRLQECRVDFFSDNTQDPYWESTYPAITHYPGDPRTLPGGDNNIGFVVGMNTCPEDTSYQAGVDNQHDPGHALYDAAAVLKHNIESNLAAGGKYNATMHAIIHSDAITCINPNGDPYDRVKVLENVGYYVNIKESPLGNGELESLNDPAKETAVANDVGYRDLTKLYAAEYENHPVVVLTDFDAMISDPLEPVLDAFVADPAKVAFAPAPPPSGAPPGAAPIADPGLILLEPDPDLVENIKNTFEEDPYDPATGWANTGVGAAGTEGGTGTAGLLTHYFENVDPDPNAVMSLGPGTLNDISVAKMSDCGSPWTCPDLSALPADQKASCEAALSQWYVGRQDFEDNCWNTNNQKAPQDGTFQAGVTQGYCQGEGLEAYDHMILDKPAPISCDKDVTTSSETGFMTFGNGKTQVQKLVVETGEYTGQDEACLNGYIAKAGFEPPYNILFVLDTSYSTKATFQGTPTGDVNGDGLVDTILDAEIGSILSVLDFIAASGDLGNDNVIIGIVNFDDEGHYLGQFSPSDPNDSTKKNQALVNLVVGLRMGPIKKTNFDSALDASVDFYANAPSGRSNLMFFLSDGKPNKGGDDDEEEDISHLRNKDSKNHPATLVYDSELSLLDSYNVHRIAVGVGSNTDIQGPSADGTIAASGLWLIDNTPDEITGIKAQQVTSTDELTDVLLSNPLVGLVIDFQVYINGVQDTSFTVADCKSGPVGFTFGTLIIGGLDPFYGSSNTVRVVVVMDYDGNAGTTSDRNELSAETVILGGLTKGDEFIAAAGRRLSPVDDAYYGFSVEPVPATPDTGHQCYGFYISNRLSDDAAGRKLLRSRSR